MSNEEKKSNRFGAPVSDNPSFEETEGKERRGKDRSGKRGSNMRPQDWTWYAETAATLEKMASFPFSSRTGDHAAGIGYPNDSYGGAVVRLGVMPSLGFIDEDSDEATLAATAFFKTLTQGYSGYSNFQPSDVMMVNVAGEMLFMLMIMGKRAFGLLDYAAQFNRYVVKAMFSAMDLDYEDWVANKASFISRYNVLASNVNANVLIPKDFSLGSRWEWLMSYIFTDREDNNRAIFTIPYLDYYLEIDETIMATGTCLKRRALTFRTVDEFFGVCNQLLATLSDNQDFSNIFATAKRVYSTDQLKKVSPLDENFHTTIGKHPAFNDSLRNAVLPDNRVRFVTPGELYTTPSQEEWLVGVPGESGEEVVVWQTSSGSIRSIPVIATLESDPMYNGSVKSLCRQPNVLLSFHDKDKVSADVVIDGTTWIHLVDDTVTYSATDPVIPATLNYNPICCRTEIITEVKLVIYQGKTLSTSTVVRNIYDPTSAMQMHYLMQCREPVRMDIVDGYTPTKLTFAGAARNISETGKSPIVRMQELSFFKLLALPTNMKSITS